MLRRPGVACRALCGVVRHEELGAGAASRMTQWLARQDPGWLTVGCATERRLEHCDLVARVDAPDEWATVTRLRPSAPPIVWSREDDAMPDALADEALLGLDPSRVSLLLVGPCDALFDRLVGLFPGAAIVAARVAGPAVMGALALDVSPREAALALADIAPRDIRFNETASRAMFEPHSVEDVAGAVLRSGTPVFFLPNAVVLPGESVTFNIFEPRYLLMIKQCVERSEPFVVALENSDVGTACAVTVWERNEETGHSLVRADGLVRVKIDGVVDYREDFGLMRLDRFGGLVNDEPPEAPDRKVIDLIAALIDKCKRMAREDDADYKLPETTVEYLAREGVAEDDPEAASWAIARRLSDLDIRVPAHIRNEWLQATDTKVRLASQVAILAMLATSMEERRKK